MPAWLTPDEQQQLSVARDLGRRELDRRIDLIVEADQTRAAQEPASWGGIGETAPRAALTRERVSQMLTAVTSQQRTELFGSPLEGAVNPETVQHLVELDQRFEQELGERDTKTVSAAGEELARFAPDLSVNSADSDRVQQALGAASLDADPEAAGRAAVWSGLLSSPEAAARTVEALDATEAGQRKLSEVMQSLPTRAELGIDVPVDNGPIPDMSSEQADAELTRQAEVEFPGLRRERQSPMARYLAERDKPGSAWKRPDSRSDGG